MGILFFLIKKKKYEYHFFLLNKYHYHIHILKLAYKYVRKASFICHTIIKSSG